MKARIPLFAALAVAMVPCRASAQAWVSNPDFSEGEGIRAGNLELHPSLGGEFGYDSNFYRAAESEGVIDVMRLRITPSLTLSTLGRARRNSPAPPTATFAAGAHAAYHEIIPLDSDESAVSDQRNVSIGADARLDVLPQGKFGFDATLAYARVLDTDGNTDDLAGEGFNRGTFRGGAGLSWRPGGGLFEWRAGYNFTYHYFEAESFDYLANAQHEVGTQGRWRFLPRSALLFDSSYTFVRYAETTPQPDGDALRARIGYRGLVTYHLALFGMIGWGATFYEPRTNGIEVRQFDSVLANAEARWFFMPQPDLDSATIATGVSSVALGYARTFNNSYQGAYYQRDRGYLQLSMFLLGALAAGLEAGVARVGFPEDGSAPAFSQTRIDGRLFAEYRFTDTLAANTTFSYDKVISDPIANEELEYDRLQAFLGLRWFL